jgi:hypothetical protein
MEHFLWELRWFLKERLPQFRCFKLGTVPSWSKYAYSAYLSWRNTSISGNKTILVRRRSI